MDISFYEMIRKFFESCLDVDEIFFGGIDIDDIVFYFEILDRKIH